MMEVLNQFLMDRKKERKKYLEKEQMISDTYTNLSHDIRTPLTSLDGYFQLLEQCDDREEQKTLHGHHPGTDPQPERNAGRAVSLYQAEKRQFSFGTEALLHQSGPEADDFFLL